MATLKQQLDRQEIINDKLMRQSMTSKLSWIKRYVWLEIAIAPILLIFFAVYHAVLGLSWWLFGFFALILVADVTADYRINRVDHTQLLTGNLVEASRRLAEMKKLRAWAFALSLVGVSVWLAWLLAELWIVVGGNTHELTRGFAAGGVFGGIVGGILGLTAAWAIFRKMQRTNDEVLAAIDQLNNCD